VIAVRFGIRELVFVLLLLAMPISAYFFVFAPRNSQIIQARIEIQQKQEKLKQLEANTANMDSLGEQIAQMADDIDLIEKRLPAQREVESVLEEVWNLADRHHLTLKSVRPEKLVAAAQYTEHPIRMDFVGGFDGFYSFLLDLENLPRITRMPSMKIKKLNDQNGAMNADVVLSIFSEGKSEELRTSAVLERGS
jgi:type IV pilus assembly protein PilO